VIVEQYFFLIVVQYEKMNRDLDNPHDQLPMLDDQQLHQFEHFDHLLKIHHWIMNNQNQVHLVFQIGLKEKAKTELWSVWLVYKWRSTLHRAIEYTVRSSHQIFYVHEHWLMLYDVTVRNLLHCVEPRFQLCWCLYYNFDESPLYMDDKFFK